MRATVDQRDTSDLVQSMEELHDDIVKHARALVHTGCVIALAHPVPATQDEARLLVLELNKAVQEYEEISQELVERGE